MVSDNCCLFVRWSWWCKGVSPWYGYPSTHVRTFWIEGKVILQSISLCEWTHASERCLCSCACTFMVTSETHLTWACMRGYIHAYCLVWVGCEHVLMHLLDPLHMHTLLAIFGYSDCKQVSLIEIGRSKHAYGIRGRCCRRMFQAWSNWFS